MERDVIQDMQRYEVDVPNRRCQSSGSRSSTDCGQTRRAPARLSAALQSRPPSGSGKRGPTLIGR